nr:retrovirus-related Pol polyprotein from transposon TNT 1-94 [Tanacetum cinerariifolium]
MVGSLMYLTANKPDLVFALCMCARYQASPTKKYLEALKQVFWYLRGTINWGLWYPKDTTMALTAYVDAYHAEYDSGYPYASSGRRRGVKEGKHVAKKIDDPDNGEALEITPIDQAHQFVSPSYSDAIMDFVNELGYTEVIYFMSRMAVNNMYQPWRAILFVINQCLTGKHVAKKIDDPDNGEALEITPIDQAHQFVSPSYSDAIMDFVNELGYTEVIYFMSRMAAQIPSSSDALGHNYNPTKKGGKDKPCVIPYCRFTKLIICHLGRTHNIYQRSASLFHLAEEDLRLGNLKFILKGEDDEVFGMPILNELISNNIRNTPYYNAYLEMVAKHDRKVAAEKGGKKKPATAKQLKSKPAKEKSSKPAPAPKPKSFIQLIDEDEPTQPEPKPEPKHQGEGDEYDIERAIQMSLKSFQVQSQEHVGATKEASTGPSVQPQDDASANFIRESLSPAYAETGADTDKTNSGEEKTVELDQGQARSDLGKTPESQPLPEQEFINEDHAGPNPGESHVALAGPNPELTHDDFMANVYPNVHESLKFLADEHVITEEPLSLTRTLSSMKNLDDTYTIGDHSTTIHTSYLSLPSKHVSPTTQAPIFTATTATTTTTLPLPPPPQQQSTTDLELVARVTTLEKKFANFEQKSQNLDNTTQNLGSRLFTLELRDLPHKINQTVNESGSYKSLPKHIALYEALEASMECANRDGFFAEKDKSRKRGYDDQDPPPPPPDSDLKAPLSSSKQQSGPYSEQLVKDVPMPDTALMSDSEDTDSAHLLKIKPRPECSYQDPEEYKLLRPSSDMSSFINWFCKRIGNKKLSKADLEGPAFKVFKAFYENNISLQFQMEECHRLLTDQVDLVNPEGYRLVSILSKPLPLRGPPGQYRHFRLKANVTTTLVQPTILLIGGLSVRISTSPDTMHHLIVVQSDLTADYNDYKISEADFKNLHLNYFKDLDRNDQKKMLRENEVHTFSNGTLTRVLHKLDYMVKDFRLYQYNSGMEYRIWSENDKRRSEEFMEVIERRLKIRRIFQSLKSFIGGQLRDVDYRILNRT